MSRTKIQDNIKFELCDDGTIIAWGSKGDPYRITLQGENSVDSCQCKGWEHRASRPADRQACRHIVSARRMALSVVPQQPEPPSEPAEVTPINKPKSARTRESILASLDDGMTAEEEVDLLMAQDTTKPSADEGEF